MQSVGGKFRVSFLLTKAWYRRKFPSTFSPQMQYVASRKFHQHCTNGWRIWVEKYVHIFLTTDAQCLQKTSERLFHTDAEYRRKTRSVSHRCKMWARITAALVKLYMKHETQCLMTRWNTEKRVENTTSSGVFLTIFEVFHLVMKH